MHTHTHTQHFRGPTVEYTESFVQKSRKIGNVQEKVMESIDFTRIIYND